MLFLDKLEFIARVRYLGWMCYQMGANLPLHDVSEDLSISAERLESLKKGTQAVLENPNMTPKDNHNLWVKTKREQGYIFGPTIDLENKTHPSIVAFEELSDVEKRKDEMDLMMVRESEKLYKMFMGQMSVETYNAFVGALNKVFRDEEV